jgi:hypothetical protein
MQGGRPRTGPSAFKLQHRLPTWRITELEAESMFSIITCSMEPRVSLQQTVSSNKKCDWKWRWTDRQQTGWQNRPS